VSPAPDLLLVGAGGLGREVVATLRVSDTGARLGFLDDAIPIGTEIDGIPVVGPATADMAAELPAAELVICAASSGDPGRRRRLVERLGVPATRYARIRHPAAVLDANEPGPGSIVLAGVVATTAVTIGAHVVLMPSVVLVHDIVVDDFSVVASGVVLGGGVHIGAGAYVGAGSAVREGCSVGAGAVVGMGAVVVHDVPPGEVWVGNPARPLPRRDPEPDASG